MADTQAEIVRITKELEKLNKAFDKEKLDRKADQERQQKQLEEVIQVILDYDRASTKVLRYAIRLDARYNNLILALQDAVMDFNMFLRLPASSNSLSKYWDVAFAALSTILPMFRIAPGWVRLEQAAQTELKAVENVLSKTSTRTQLVTWAQRGHNIADWVAKENTIAARLRDIQLVKPKADMSRTPVKALMEESNAAHKALEAVVDTIFEDYKARLLSAVVGNAYAKTESLAEMADRLLPALNYVEQTDTDQVKRTFLYEICKAWAPKNVAIVTTVYRIGETVTIDGLNDTQQDQIVDWFGPSSSWAGGTVPVWWSVWHYLYLWGVPRRKDSSGGSSFGFG